MDIAANRPVAAVTVEWSRPSKIANKFILPSVGYDYYGDDKTRAVAMQSCAYYDPNFKELGPGWGPFRDAYVATKDPLAPQVAQAAEQLRAAVDTLDLKSLDTVVNDGHQQPNVAYMRLTTPDGINHPYSFNTDDSRPGLHDVLVRADALEKAILKYGTKFGLSGKTGE